VAFFGCFNPSATTTTSLASKRESEWFLSVIPSTPLPPPPSRPNANWRWFFWAFQRVCHHHHLLPRVPTRAGGGFFWLFQHIYHRHHLPRIQMRAGTFGVYRRWGVSFPWYQRRSSVKLTLRPVQLFSLASGMACNFVALFTTPQ